MGCGARNFSTYMHINNGGKIFWKIFIRGKYFSHSFSSFIVYTGYYLS